MPTKFIKDPNTGKVNFVRTKFCSDEPPMHAQRALEKTLLDQNDNCQTLEDLKALNTAALADGNLATIGLLESQAGLVHPQNEAILEVCLEDLKKEVCLEDATAEDVRKHLESVQWNLSFWDRVCDKGRGYIGEGNTRMQ